MRKDNINLFDSSMYNSDMGWYNDAVDRLQVYTVGFIQRIEQPIRLVVTANIDRLTRAYCERQYIRE